MSEERPWTTKRPTDDIMLELFVGPDEDPEAALDELADALVALWLDAREAATLPCAEPPAPAAASRRPRRTA